MEEEAKDRITLKVTRDPSACYTSSGQFKKFYDIRGSLETVNMVAVDEKEEEAEVCVAVLITESSLDGCLSVTTCLPSSVCWNNESPLGDNPTE